MTDYRKQLEAIGGYENELLPVPAGGVRKIIDDLEKAQQQLAAEQADNSRLRGLLTRYLNEVPLGHQPYMIAHEVAATLTKHPDDTALREWSARLLRKLAEQCYQPGSYMHDNLMAHAEQLRSGDWKPCS